MNSPHSSAACALVTRYLAGYSTTVVQQAQHLLQQGKLHAWLAKHYPEQHTVQSDKALYDYCQQLKQQYLRNSTALSKVHFDNKLQTLQQALGTHTSVSRVQGSKLKQKTEIRIASLFKSAPAALLRMIVVHELAHIKEKDHNKAFYQLCQYMEPEYFQLELAARLFLIAQEAG